ncbi:MAG: asparagine synthase (glutamine-hydrolyzing) [Gemmatimonadota bacterium]|nr:asparagine synthase (glutamine-hydrolyzing) [Gemmatimonadota bacterium]
MCGIAGILDFDDPKMRRDRIKRMTDAIAHRGPDDEGIYVAGKIGLGHRRLAIIDLSDHGAQPMANEDETVWITFNGEIYNYLEIRTNLQHRGHSFRSNSDTEVIVHAYEEWGIDSLKYLNGMFAFGLWDERLQRLWLVRDRLGIKPLFYCHMPNCIIFGSEIKAILAVERVRRTISLEALAYYLALNYTPAPHTLFLNIFQLLPGHYITVDESGRIQDVEYWDLVYDESENLGEEEYVRQLNELLEDAVRLRLASDVPYGAFLSGGLDSSGIVYWMSRNTRDRIRTFSIGFEEESFNELPYAQLVANSIKAHHREYVLTADSAYRLPQMVWHSEEPTADSSMVPVYFLAEKAREFVKMVLCGDGADELLAGYETYQAYFLHRLFRIIPKWLQQRVLRPFVYSLPMSDTKFGWVTRARRFIDGAEFSSEDAHATRRMILNADARHNLLSQMSDNPEIYADVVDLYRGLFARTNASHPLNRMLYVDTRFYLPNDMLVKMDRMTMSHGLEARVPYLDHRLVEFLASVPANMKLKWFYCKKYLLKESLKGKIPDTILSRTKQGLNIPNARWIRKELKPFVTDHLSCSSIRKIGLFNDATVEQLLAEHFEGKSDNSHQIWCLLTFVIWWRQFM